MIEVWQTREREVLVEGPAGCVAGETELWDPIAGVGRRIDALAWSGVRPWVQTMHGPVLAEAPFLKGYAPLYRVTLESGETCVATAEHLFLTRQGWQPVSALALGTELRLGSPVGGPRCTQTDAGSQDRCSTDLRRCDPQLQGALGGDQASSPSAVDARGRTRSGWRAGDPASGPASTRSCPACDRLSKPGSSAHARCEPSGASPVRVPATTGAGCRAVRDTSERAACSSQRPHRWSQALLLPGPSEQPSSGVCGTLKRAPSVPVHQPCPKRRARWGRVKDLRYERTDFYYDLHVPGPEHYLAGGIWSHNSGKTRVDLELDLWLASTYPRMRILWTRATLTSLRQSILVTFEEHVLGGRRHPCQHGKASRDHRTSYRFPNGSEIVLGGLDDPAKTYSMEYSKFTVFEAIQCSLDSYERLLRLLRWPHGPYRQARLETNPGWESHWINRRPERLKKNGKPQLHRIKTLHRDNPMFWDYERDCLNQWGEEYVNESLAGMSGDRRQNMLDGVWTAGSGMVWPEYDRTLHLIDRKFVPELSTYIASMDFGFNAPGCLQVWGGRGDGKWYRVAEVYRTGWHINQWADAVAELWAEYRFQVGIADCAEPGSISILNKRLGQLEGRDSGAAFIAADKSRGKQHGLNQVRAALDPTQEGGPRLFLVQGALRHRDEKLASEGKPTCTEEEIPGYQFQEPDPEKPLRETPDPKYPNEGCDAAEYFWTWIYSKFLNPAGHVEIRPGSAADVLGWKHKRRTR